MKQIDFLKGILILVLLTSSFFAKANIYEERNKAIVRDFYEGVFIKHEVAKYSDKYIGNVYTQHNPHVADGKKPFVDYFTQYFIDNPDSRHIIKKIIADNDLVVLHVHSMDNKQDRGQAIVDIFRVKNNKIVEHWDVIQAIPETSSNNNTMF
ncbi:polyketide cyclase [Neisseriaceae bacterium PsAf]|nr:polyketide cyclase [Neisseriaceae bacterium PsAf]